MNDFLVFLLFFFAIPMIAIGISGLYNHNDIGPTNDKS